MFFVDPRDKRPALVMGYDCAINACHFSPFHREMVVTGDVNGTLGLWDVRVPAPLFRIRGHTQTINSCQFSPHDRNILLSTSVDQTAKVYDLALVEEDPTIVRSAA